MVLNKDLHRANFLNILRDIYSHPDLRTRLGFKGGTAALLFYNLPRFSVDLDFDLLDLSKKEVIFEKVRDILQKQGVLSQAWEKQYTLFYLLHYQKGERTLKIEISKRPNRSFFELKNYLGIPMLVMKQSDMTASKLSAFLTRKRFASRDLFDLWFFLKNNWPISEEIIKERMGFSLEKAFKEVIKKVESISKDQLLRGLGELLENNKQKAFVRGKLQDELLFLLKLYLNNLEKEKKQI